VSGDRLLPIRLRSLESDTLPQVDLCFTGDGAGRTWLSRQRAAYPFHVGRCLTLADAPPGMAAAFIQCCSGGIFEHDDLRWSIEAGGGTLAHVATSASTLVHSMEQGEACQDVTVAAAAGAVLEYFPEPLILFPAARLRNRLHIRLGDGAVVLAWDAVLAHDPARDAAPDRPPRWFDRIHSELSVESFGGRLLARDRYLLSGSVLADRLPGVTGPFRCHGTFVVLGNAVPAAPLVETLRAALDSASEAYAGVSSLPNACGVVVRVQAPDAVALRAALHAVRASARFLLSRVRR
jgi:urease accessory protein